MLFDQNGKTVESGVCKEPKCTHYSQTYLVLADIQIPICFFSVDGKNALPISEFDFPFPRYLFQTKLFCIHCQYVFQKAKM